MISYLPKLRSGIENRFPDPPHVGVWDERPNSHLAALSEAIDIPPAEYRIYSVPDPWARAILFDRALFTDGHPLQTRTLGEWRGLLAVLGLRERRAFQGLSAKEADLRNSKDGSFSAVLSQLHPPHELDNQISAETGWDRFYILKWQSQSNGAKAQPFAFTSPSTLVCTGADYAQVLSSQEIPWFIDPSGSADELHGGILADPIKFLAPRERAALAEWIHLVCHKIAHIEGRASRKNWIIRLLGNFASDLDSSVSVPVASETSDPAASPEALLLSDSSLSMTSGLYRTLDQPRKGEIHAISDLQIVTTKKDAPRFVLVDSRIAQQWDRNPRDLTVFKNITLATSDRLLSSRKNSGQLESDFSWCTPDFIFSSRLIIEQNPEPAFPGCLPVKSTGGPAKNAVLPLNPEVLQLFTPREIADRLTLEWLKDGEVTCTLVLLLRSGDSNPQPYRLKKTYSAAEITPIKILPLISVWPNFRLEGIPWKAYFTFEYWQGDRDELSVTPWSASEPSASDHRKHSLDGKRFQVHRTASYPEAFICESTYFDSKLHADAFATGILLLDPAPLIPSSSHSSAVLGIDFGSTGSKVYVRMGDQENKQPITFKSRSRAITDVAPGIAQDTSRDLFLPMKDWTAESILSVFHDFGDPKSGDNDRVVLRDGHVLYADEPDKFITKDSDRRRIISNLKWGEERERIAARDFLMQLCLQAAAELAPEGVTEVDVRFSYPTAFSKRDRANFAGYWRTVVNRASQLTGITFELNREKVDNREAITATRFFSDANSLSGERLDVGGGAVTVDIGGGTTDVAVWNKLSLLTHSSIVFAGRDIFLTPIWRKPAILAEIDSKPLPETVLKGARGDSAFRAQIDAVISRRGKAMIEAIPNRHTRDSVSGFLDILELGLCGLCFYSGTLVRAAVEAKKFQAGRRIQIFVGGNGSNLFLWCARGADLSDTEVYENAANCFLSAANLTNVRCDIHLSKAPKSEVAYGLVCDPIKEFTAPAEDKIAAESFMLGSEIMPWNSEPTANDILDGRASPDRNFPIFSNFLSLMHRKVDPDILDRLGGHVDLRFAQQAKEIEKAMKTGKGFSAEDSLRTEPVFIMALKSYLEMEIDAWEKTF